MMQKNSVGAECVMRRWQQQRILGRCPSQPITWNAGARAIGAESDEPDAA